MGVTSCMSCIRNLLSRGETASAIVAPPGVSGSHVLKVDGYSRTKGLGNGQFIRSETFDTAGHRWCLQYYPDGCNSETTDWISFFLVPDLDHSHANEVRAQYKISLLDQDSQPVPPYIGCSSQIRTFSGSPWGFPQFIQRQVLEVSHCLKDDVFRIRCEVTVVMEIFTEHIPPPSVVVVPPSDMHRHLGQLLLSDEAADVTFEVGAEIFPAHRCVLAARSSVFKAELLGPMKEKTASRVRIDDMESNVFRALLHFVYTDSLRPEIDQGSDTAPMFQHLLVAADRYNMERLKLICEDRLCKNICDTTAATTLTLAEQHGCSALKKACFKFLTSPGNLKAVMASDGYQHLRTSCPSVIQELLIKLVP